MQEINQDQLTFNKGFYYYNNEKLKEFLVKGSLLNCIPTSVGEDTACLINFSIKDCNLPKDLPKKTNIYCKEIRVKIQDTYSQTTCNDMFKNGICQCPLPYTMVLINNYNDIDFYGKEKYIYSKKLNRNGQILFNEKNEMILEKKKVNIINSDLIENRLCDKYYSMAFNLSSFNIINLLDQNYNFGLLKIIKDENGDYNKLKLDNCKSLSLDDYINIMEGNRQISKNGDYIPIDFYFCSYLMFIKNVYNMDSIPTENVLKLKDTNTFTKLENQNKINKKILGNEYFNDKNNNDEFLNKGDYILFDSTTKSRKLFSNSFPLNTCFKDNKNLLQDFTCDYRFIINEYVATLTYL